MSTINVSFVVCIEKRALGRFLLLSFEVFCCFVSSYNIPFVSSFFIIKAAAKPSAFVGRRVCFVARALLSPIPEYIYIRRSMSHTLGLPSIDDFLLFHHRPRLTPRYVRPASRRGWCVVYRKRNVANPSGKVEYTQLEAHFFSPSSFSETVYSNNRAVRRTKIDVVISSTQGLEAAMQLPNCIVFGLCRRLAT